MTTISGTFSSEVLPSMAATIICLFFWFIACRRIKCTEDAAHNTQMEVNGLVEQVSFARSGTPSDRLFLGSLMALSFIGALVAVLHAIYFSCLFAGQCQ